MLRPLFYLCVLIALQGAARAEICTVTGPTIIDFQGHLNNVMDRCAYSLISDSDSGLEVVANFLERRRRDVSFVDSVTLTVGLNKIVLQQGGKVLVNNQVESSLSSTPQMFFGVGIAKDETGVDVEYVTTEYTINVFFDGTTAQISTEATVSENSTLTGLCVDSSDVPSERLPNSPSSCTEQFQDAADSSINCATLTTRCELLRDSLLSSCNADVDPQPFIDACKNTLCKYSTVDNLRCQFMRAYARACRLNGHLVPSSWWAKTRCFNRAFCQDVFCTENEFCGRKFSGDNACLCRAVFAYKYNVADTLGEPTKCENNVASLSLFNCLLEGRGINYTRLHLNDPTCRGQLDRDTNTVTYSFSSSNICGAEISTSSSEINYTNAIMSENSTDLITRHDQVFIQFSCYRPQPELKSVAFKIKDNSYVKPVTSGKWTYTVSMTPYIDEKCTKVVATETDVKLDQKVWVVLKTHGLDPRTIAVVTKSCWATSDSNPNSMPRYDLIIDGCPNPADGTVQVTGNGVGTSNRFSFNMFEFTRHPDNVYLHCQLQLCLKDGNNCVEVCPKRRRRFVKTRYNQGEAAFISMGWSK